MAIPPSQRRSGDHVGQDGFPEFHQTAVMLRKVFRTRFASHESMLEAYLRTRGVLLDIVFSGEFSTILWDCRNKTERDRRANGYMKLIESGEFFHSVKELHNVFRIMSTYPRTFEEDDARIIPVKLSRQTRWITNWKKYP